MDKNINLKRRFRNLSEKKRRDQFNNLINELNHLIDPHFISQNDDDDDDTGSCSNLCTATAAGGVRGAQRKMDKSSVLRHAMEFLKSHIKPPAHTSDGSLSSQREQSSPSNENASQVLAETNCYNTSYWKPPYITDDEFSVQMLEAMDAFIIVCEVDEVARIIYSSDTLTNLLNYTGTCNPLRQHDYVSLFDLIAPADETQIRELFSREPLGSGPVENDIENRPKSMGPNSSTLTKSLLHDVQSFSSSETGDDEYVSLLVNFRTGLNLTEIKQNRQRYKAGDETSNMADCAALKHHCSVGGSQASKAVASEHIDHFIDQQKPCHEHFERQKLGPLERQDSQDAVHEQVVNDNRAICSRGQQSIAERQRLLMSESRREQQEHNQHEQQKRQLQSRQEADIMQGVDEKQLTYDNQMSDGPNSDTARSDEATQVSKASSENNSEENSDQPSGVGSDDASDCNRSRGAVSGERRHQYRHQHNSEGSQEHHYNHHHRQLQPIHRQQRSNGQRDELVILMGTFKEFGDDSSCADEGNYGNHHTFEEPLSPFPPPPATRSLAKKRYFICTGKLDIPRFSYDLKIIVPPVTSGINLFHNNQFTSKHTLKWRFLWIDSRATSIIGYSPFELLGTSGYDYYHWDDLDKLVMSHESLMREGKASSGPYRFLTKGQQWIWLETKYTIVFKPPSGDAQRKKSTRYQSLSSGASTGQDSRAVARPEAMKYKDKHLVRSYSRESAADYGEPNFRHSMLDDYITRENQHQDFQDGLLGVKNQFFGQQMSTDEGSVIYTVSTPGDHGSEPKRFKLDHDIADVATSSPSQLAACGDENRSDGTTVADVEQSTSKRENSLTNCSPYTTVTKRQNPRQSIDNHLSKSFDQFKFVLCTHTVIGFDESDNR